jgi:DNA-binding MarR family transcriptional regulator
LSEIPASASFYSGDSYDPHTSVGYQILQLGTLIRREVDVRMAAHGLTDAQWKPLFMLGAGRAETAHELARVLDCDAGAITRMLDRLEAKGLIERVRSDTDRRVVYLRLTEAGRAAADSVPHVLADAHNDLFAGFSAGEWIQLRDFISRLITNANEFATGRPAE